MSNILGIIAEYNPFHNGHMYHIKKAKEITKADYVIAIMNGNFTQRGNVSIVNKWEKTKMALANEVDMVIELPTIYGTSSAENFANGAIKILKELNCITHISFGMEEDNIKDLKHIAEILSKEPKEYVTLLKEELTKGVSYPKAREKAIIRYFKDNKYAEILNGSNNILAIEYLKSMMKYKLNAIPVGIKREMVMYNSNNIIGEYASATAIRHLLLTNSYEKIAKVVPESTQIILRENIKNGTLVYDLTEFEKMIIYKLRTISKKEITNISDISEGLENAISTAVSKTNNLLELIDLLKTKRYTQTRIQRILIYILLGITKKDMEISKKTMPYIRILGVSKNGEKLLSQINRENVITSLKSFEEKNINRSYTRMLNIDKNATDIYTIAYKNNSFSNLDYTTKLLK